MTGILRHAGGIHAGGIHAGGIHAGGIHIVGNRKKKKETDGKLLKTTLTKNNGGKDWSNLPKPKSLR